MLTIWSLNLIRVLFYIFIIYTLLFMGIGAFVQDKRSDGAKDGEFYWTFLVQHIYRPINDCHLLYIYISTKELKPHECFLGHRTYIWNRIYCIDKYIYIWSLSFDVYFYVIISKHDVLKYGKREKIYIYMMVQYISIQNKYEIMDINIHKFLS